MKKTFFAALCLIALSGCMNLYTRCPGTDGEITSPYQSSRRVVCASVIVAFPQMMSDTPQSGGPHIVNIVSIPLGLVVLCDGAVEAVIDTVCLPFDWPVSEYRKGRYLESSHRGAHIPDGANRGNYVIRDCEGE